MTTIRWLLVLAAVMGSAPGAGEFRLRVRNAAPARYYLEDASGTMRAPPGAVVYSMRGEQHFLTPAGFEIDLPAGRYTLLAERGPEYRSFRATIDATAGGERTVDVAVERWVDMNRRGWYSGDLHNHRRPEDMPLLLRAENLNLAPTLADWIWDDRARSSAAGSAGPAVRRVDATHAFSVLDMEVERLKDGPGAVDLLGLRMRVPFDGYALYPPNDVFATRAHAQGGWVDAEKIVWRDAAALVALGHVDFAGIVYNHFNRQGVESETDSWGMIPKTRPEYRTPEGMPLWAMEVYYRLLNCGFRLPVSAGSASGVKAAPLGYNRVYVRLREPFGYESWFRALKAGRSFATNGPMLFLTVDGKEPGGAVRGGRVRIRAEAVSPTPLDRLEVVFNGRTIRTERGAGKLAVDFRFDAAESGWIAARAFEKPDRTVRFAHTSPVYVEAAGRRSAAVREDARYFVNWMDREMRFYERAAGFREPGHREAMLEFFASARRVFERLASD